MKPSRCTSTHGGVRCSQQSGHKGNHHGRRTVSTVEHYENFHTAESTEEPVAWPQRRTLRPAGGRP